MQADLPHTLYMKDKADSSKNTKASDEVIRLQEEANRKARERKEKESGKIPYDSVDEVFNR